MYKANKEHEIIDHIDNFNDFFNKKDNERYIIEGANQQVLFYIEDPELRKEYLEFKKTKENK